MAKDWSKYIVKESPNIDKWAKYISEPEYKKGHVPPAQTFTQRAKQTLNEWVPPEQSLFDEAPTGNPIASNRTIAHATAPFVDYLRGRGEELYNMGVSGANLLPGVNIEHADTSDWRTNSPLAPYAEMGGKIQSNITGISKGAQLANKHLPAMEGVTTMAKMINAARRPAGAALAGYALGESGDDPGYTNFGRLFGAGAGAILPGAEKAAKGALEFSKKVPNAINTELQASNVLKGAAKAEKASEKMYTQLHKVAEEAAIKLNPNTIEPHLEYFLKHGTPNMKETARKLLESPTAKNAHDFMKQAGKIKPTSQHADFAYEAKDAIKDELFKAFKESGNPKLIKELEVANKHYIENVLPHRNDIIKKYQAGKLTKEDFVRDLSRNKTFKAQKGHEYPELLTRGILEHSKWPLTVGGGLGVTAPIVNYGWHKIFD